MTDQHDFDFLHHLQDTLTLLGGSLETRALIEKLMDGKIVEADIDKLRCYNVILITEVKSRLANLHTIKIKSSSDESD